MFSSYRLLIPNFNTAPRPPSSDLLAILEDQGYRSTYQRRTVVGMLERKGDGFTAEEVAEELPKVGRATVYRTIKLLLKAGMLCKLPLPNGAHKYIMARAEHHHHTVCVRCGAVGEFRNSTVERVLRAIGSDMPGEIVGHRMELYLICRDCLNAPAE